MVRAEKKLYVLGFIIILHLGLSAQSLAPNCSEVKTYAGVPALFINGEPYPPYAYMSYLGAETYYKEAAQAGVHIYLDTDEVFYIGRGWMCVHSVTGGERLVKLPYYARITDPSNDQVVADSSNYIELNLSPNSTILLRINPFEKPPIK